MGPTRGPRPVRTPPPLHPGATPCPYSPDAGHILRSQADLNLGETPFDPQACASSLAQFFPKPAPQLDEKLECPSCLGWLSWGVSQDTPTEQPGGPCV